MDEFRQQKKDHDASIRQQLQGTSKNLIGESPSAKPAHSGEGPGAEDAAESVGSSFVQACADRRYDEATALFEADLADARAAGDRIHLAKMHAQRAACLRRVFQPENALQYADQALKLVPTHGNALFQRALALLDLGRTTGTVRVSNQQYTWSSDDRSCVSCVCVRDGGTCDCDCALSCLPVLRQYSGAGTWLYLPCVS